MSVQIQSCSSSKGSGSEVAANGGTSSLSNGGTAGIRATGGSSVAGNSFATGGSAAGGSNVISTGGSVTQGGANGATGGKANTATQTGGAATGGSSTTITSCATGGSSENAGSGATGGITGVGGTTAGSSSYVVALVQSSKAQASDLTEDDVEKMVNTAVAQAGGLDFIHDGQTVVLKPNLLTHLAQCWMGTDTLSPTVNGVTTDWRITKAVAELVRAKNPTGEILVMEGSNRNTTAAFAALGYTSANFGRHVDEFIAIEGSGCDSRSQDGLVQKPGHTGTQYWINQRYFQADVVISLGALKSHSSAGITGCVKNVGIGVTPNAM